MSALDWIGVSVGLLVAVVAFSAGRNLFPSGKALDDAFGEGMEAAKASDELTTDPGQDTDFSDASPWLVNVLARWDYLDPIIWLAALDKGWFASDRPELGSGAPRYAIGAA